jgi:molecular chaperone DnaK
MKGEIPMLLPGIDPGNSRLKSAVADTSGVPKLITNRFGEPFTPSAVYFAVDGSIIIGTEALNAGFVDPKRLVENWKRAMGTNKPLYTDDNGKVYYAKDILAILLKDAKDNLEAKTGKVVNESILTVPASYNDLQKQETIDAAASVGITAILLPHEPTAAALGNELYKKNNSTVLVYDLGGGTFDVSIIKSQGNICEIIATDGTLVGGKDFNDRLAEKILDKFESKHGFRPSKSEHPVFFQEMMQRIEQLKMALSVQQQGQITLFCEGKQIQMTITREQFNDWVTDLVDKTMQITAKTVQDAGLDFSQIEEIYAVGGGSMMNTVIENLEELTGKKVSKHCEAHCAASFGAVVAGRIEYGRQGKPYKCGEGDVTLPPPDIIVHDILSHTIGVMVLDENNKEICNEILARNTAIPSIQTKQFKLSEPNQTAVSIKILEGEDGAVASDCLSLGHFELLDLPPRPDLIGRIEVTLSLDSNGLLSAKARDNASGKASEMEIDYKVKEDDSSQKVV